MLNIFSYQENANGNNFEIPTYSCQKWLKLETPMTIYAGKYAEKGEHSFTFGGVQTCTAILVISMTVPQENGNQSTTGPNNSTLRHIPK